jgi:hypothetical protein
MSVIGTYFGHEKIKLSKDQEPSSTTTIIATTSSSKRTFFTEGPPNPTQHYMVPVNDSKMEEILTFFASNDPDRGAATSSFVLFMVIDKVGRALDCVTSGRFLRARTYWLFLLTCERFPRPTTTSTAVWLHASIVLSYKNPSKIFQRNECP